MLAEARETTVVARILLLFLCVITERNERKNKPRRETNERALAFREREEKEKKSSVHPFKEQRGVLRTS